MIMRVPNPDSFGKTRPAIINLQTNICYDRSVAALVLGIIGIFPCSLIALILGYRTMNAYDDVAITGAIPMNNQGKPVSRTMAKAGFILGIIGLCLAALWIVVITSAASA